MSRVFATTFALSTAVHLAAVYFGPSSAPARPAGNPVVALTLIPPAAAHAARTADPIAKPQPPAEPRAIAHTPMRTVPKHVRSMTSPQPLPTTAPTDTPRLRTVATTNESSKDIASDDETSDAIMQQIQALLSGRFHYPLLARKRGWEGVVEIALNLAPDGRITQVQLHRASGHAVLDNAALASAAGLRIVPNVMPLLQGRAREMIIPVHYRLRES